MPEIFSNSQDIETICLLTGEWIKKSGVYIDIHIIQAKKEGNLGGGGVKMAEERDGENTFSSTNSSKEHLNAE